MTIIARQQAEILIIYRQNDKDWVVSGTACGTGVIFLFGPAVHAFIHKMEEEISFESVLDPADVCACLSVAAKLMNGFALQV